MLHHRLDNRRKAQTYTYLVKRMSKLPKMVNKLEQVSQNSGYLSCNLKEKLGASKAKRKENSRDEKKL